MVNTKKIRSPYFDIAKGILIAYLIIHHIVDFSIRNFGVHDDSVLLFIREAQRPIMLCYFMQAFFLITGYCSNFQSDFKSFVIKQVKTLLFPAILFTALYYCAKFDFVGYVETTLLYGTKFWFLTSLFFSKILYWFIQKYVRNQYWALIALLLISLLGTILNDMDLFPNYWWHRQTLDLTVFLHIGQMLKEKLNNKRLTYIALFFYIFSLGLCYLTGAKIPHVTAGFSTTINLWPVHICLSVFGSILLLKICMFIKNSVVLEYWGKNSLTIYLFQDVAITAVLAFCKRYLQTDNTLLSFTVIMIMWASILCILSIISKILESKYLKWTLGKW